MYTLRHIAEAVGFRVRPHDDGTPHRVSALQYIRGEPKRIIGRIIYENFKTEEYARKSLDTDIESGTMFTSNIPHKQWAQLSAETKQTHALKVYGLPAVLGYQIVDTQGRTAHGELDEPFGLSANDVLQGKAAETASAWFALYDKPKYYLAPVYEGDVNPDAMCIIDSPMTVRARAFAELAGIEVVPHATRPGKFIFRVAEAMKPFSSAEGIYLETMSSSTPCSSEEKAWFDAIGIVDLASRIKREVPSDQWLRLGSLERGKLVVETFRAEVPAPAPMTTAKIAGAMIMSASRQPKPG